MADELSQGSRGMQCGESRLFGLSLDLRRARIARDVQPNQHIRTFPQRVQIETRLPGKRSNVYQPLVSQTRRLTAFGVCFHYATCSILNFTFWLDLTTFVLLMHVSR